MFAIFCKINAVDYRRKFLSELSESEGLSQKKIWKEIDIVWIIGELLTYLWVMKGVFQIN